MPSSRDSYSKAKQTGKRAELLFELDMNDMNIKTEPINDTYDILLVKNRYAIEVKSSTVNYNIVSKDTVFKGNFSFKFTRNQCKEDAFDYAVCYGFNKKKKVKYTWVIPQKIIHHLSKGWDFYDSNTGRKTKNYTIVIPNGNHQQIVSEYTFDAWRMYEPYLNKLDLLDEDNKTTFKRKNTLLTKKFIEFERKRKEKYLGKILQLWGKGYSKEEIREILQVGGSEMLEFCHDNGLTGRNPLTYNKKPTQIHIVNKESFTKECMEEFKKNHRGKVTGFIDSFECEGCGYTTSWGKRMYEHLNRKIPCSVKAHHACKGGSSLCKGITNKPARSGSYKSYKGQKDWGGSYRREK